MRGSRLAAALRHTSAVEWIFAATLIASCSLVLLRSAVRAFRSDAYGLAASLQDDSFYYLLPAFNFSHVSFGRFTFDGEHLTYGFQPAYMVALTAIAAFCGDVEELLRSAVFFNAILHCGTAVFIYLSVCRALSEAEPLVSRAWAAVAGCFYLSHATLFLSNTTVKENAAAAFLLAAALFLALEVARRGPIERGATTRLIGLGVLMGLLALCRILPTTMLLLGVLTFWVLVHARKRLLFLAALSLPGVVWGAFAWWSFGQLFPTSGAAKSLSVAELWAILSPSVLREMMDLIRLYLVEVLRFTANMGSTFYIPQIDSAEFGADGAPVSRDPHFWLTWLLLGTGSLSLILQGFLSSLRSSRPLRLLFCLILANLFGYVLTIPLLWPRRQEFFYFTWYLYAFPVLIATSAGVLSGDLTQRGVLWWKERARGLGSRDEGHRRVRFLEIAGAGIAAALLIASVGVVFARAHPLGPLDPQAERWQHAMIRAALYLRDEVKIGPNDRVGAWSSGALGFVLPGAVVNMDGLANDEALTHPGETWRDRAARFGINYYADVADPVQLHVKYELLATMATGHPGHPSLYVARISTEALE